MNDTEHTLHLIGDVARRTGLSVSAIRYYSDEGLVRPPGETDGGHRLDTGLEQIRSVLTGVVSLGDLLAEHLDVVEHRARELQSKRAVLRALVSGDSTSEHARLLQRLVTMSDEERQRLIDDFLHSVSADLPENAVEKIRAAHPRLSEDPSPQQLDAWISLSELLRDERYREETRAYLRETYASDIGMQMAAPPMQDFISSAGADLMPKLTAAREAGLAPDDPQVIVLTDQFIEQSATAAGATPPATTFVSVWRPCTAKSTLLRGRRWSTRPTAPRRDATSNWSRSSTISRILMRNSPVVPKAQSQDRISAASADGSPRPSSRRSASGCGLMRLPYLTK